MLHSELFLVSRVFVFPENEKIGIEGYKAVCQLAEARNCHQRGHAS